MESQLRAWLALQCGTIAGAEAGLVVAGASAHAPGAHGAAWPADAPPTPRLVATVEAAREGGTPLLQPPPPLQDGAVGPAHVAVPLRHEGAVVGAVGIALTGLAPPDLKHATDLLAFAARGLEPFLGPSDEGSAALVVAGRVLEAGALPEAAHALAAEVARREGCERVAVGVTRAGRMRVVGLSSSLRFREESDAVRELCAAMEEATDQDARIDRAADGAPTDHVVLAHDRLREASGAAAVTTVPLVARGEIAGALTAEWGRGTRPAGGGLDDVAALCGPILGLQARAEAGPVERTRVAAAAAVERWLGRDRRLALAVLGGLAALLVLLAIFPATYRVGARATLEGRVQRAVVAGVDGYLAEARVRAGDVVSAGDLLARLDDRDLALALRQRRSEQVQLEREYREAFAARDRSEVSILRAQLDQAAAKLALVEEQLGRTRVVAPFDGVVLEGDLDQALGSPVELGTVLYELAPLDGYRVVLEVDGRDIADVAPGQSGRIALSALPGHTLPLAIERITPVSTTADGRHYFRVEAALEEPLNALRPGMEGLAKIEVGRRPLIWIWTHGLVDWLRLQLWTWLP